MLFPSFVLARMDAMSTCPQCHGQGGFSYRRRNGLLSFEFCTSCRGYRSIDDGEPLSPAGPSQRPPWPAPLRSDRYPVAGRWLTSGGCLDVWPAGRMNLVKEWAYELGTIGRGVALWNGASVAMLLAGRPLGGRGYFLRFSDNSSSIAGVCVIRRGPQLPISFQRA